MLDSPNMLRSISVFTDDFVGVKKKMPGKHFWWTQSRWSSLKRRWEARVIVITLYHFGRLDLVFLSQCTVSSDIVECVLILYHNLQGFITIWSISLACLDACSFTKYRTGVKFCCRIFLPFQTYQNKQNFPPRPSSNIFLLDQVAKIFNKSSTKTLKIYSS